MTNRIASLLSRPLAAAAAAALALGAGATLAQSNDRVDGVVQKVDAAANKITLKHGEIRNLDMPAMTMVFQARDPAMLARVKPGDKVRFTAAKSGGALVVTTLEPAN